MGDGGRDSRYIWNSVVEFDNTLDSCLEPTMMALKANVDTNELVDWKGEDSRCSSLCKLSDVFDSRSNEFCDECVTSKENVCI